MGIPSGYSRNVISGKLPGGEIWQCSLWANEAPSDLAATQAQATAFAGKIQTDAANAGSPVSLLASGGTMDLLTTYSYLDSSGKATFVANAPITTSAPAGTQTLPDQVTLCVTLLTGLAGRRHRGRVFVPYQTGALTAGQISNTIATNVATWWSTLITHLNSTLGTQHIVVLSQVAGTSNTVNAVQVDTKLDIQRRRADKVVPTSKALVAVT